MRTYNRWWKTLPTIAVQRTAWSCYGIGIGIVALSYLDILGPKVGWLGFIVGLGGFLLFQLKKLGRFTL